MGHEALATRARSAPRGEEGLEQSGALGFADAPVNFRRVVAGRLPEEMWPVIDSAPFGVGRGIVQSADAGMGDCAGAHRTGFQRHIKIAANKTLGADRRRGLADGEQFGVRRRVGQFAGAVAGAGDHGPVADKPGADRRLAARLGRPRFGEGEAHQIAGFVSAGGRGEVSLPSGDRRAEAFFIWRVHAFGHRTGARSRQCGSRFGLDLSSMNDETKPGSEVREGQRIAKVMARAGLCSRREAETWIASGRVSVNGKALDTPAYNVSETDDVRVDGSPLAAPERTRLFLFHKTRGLVTTARDPEGRPTIFDALPPDLPRVVAIGRLDINTEGLLLLTNDGGLARVLELPATGWLRRYRVRAHGSIDQAKLDALSEGITLDGIGYAGIEARLDREQGSNVWITMGLREGKNREIKKVLDHMGMAVNRLIRVSFGPFELGDLAEGEVAEVRTRVLRDQLGVRLAKEAGVHFDAPLIARAEPKPAPTEERRDRRTSPGRESAGGAKRGRSDEGRGPRYERDEAKSRRAPPTPSTPERRRKHVSALRAEIAAEAAGPRKRIERSATQDRKGRKIAVERISKADQGALEGPPGQTRGRRRAEHPDSGERRGRNFEGGRDVSERPRRADSFEAKRARDGAGRERPPRPEGKERGPRPDFKPRDPGEARDGKPRERRFDRPAGERAGKRVAGAARPGRDAQGSNRERPSRSDRSDGAARERKFDRRPAEPRGKGGGGGPPRTSRTSPKGPGRPPGKGPARGPGGSRRPRKH
jgi:23S rRNA pseudouridine2605 synthase